MTAEAGDAPKPAEILRFTADMLDKPPVDRRLEFERGMRYFPPITQGMIAACCAAFAWQVTSGGLGNAEALVASGALVAANLGDGEVWRLFSSLFLHASGDHLLGNMVVLFIVGIACEHAFGPLTMLGIYLASGAAGGLATAAIDPMPTVGASGAIFGLMGCLIAMLARRRRIVHVRDGRIAIVVALWAAWQLVMGFASPIVANFAHLGGFVAGGVLGWVIMPRLLAVASPAAELLP
jgi:rhomboid protease GluP